MRIMILVVSSIVLFGFSAVPAMASGKSWLAWIFTPPWPHYERPYLENGKVPNNAQWENDDWTPEGWVQDKGSKEAVMKGLTNAKIITDLEMDRDVPVMEVGYRYLQLSDKEKIHVAKFVDYVYGATKKKGGAMVIEYNNGLWLIPDKQVGVYTPAGLQIQ